MQPVASNSLPAAIDQTSQIARPSKLKLLCQKIVQAVASVFTCLASFFKRLFCCGEIATLFSPNETKLLRDDRNIPHTPPLLSDRKISVPAESKHDTAAEGDKQTKTQITYSVFDDSLESLREFLRDFTSLTVDIVYENTLEPKLQKLQSDAPTISSSLKSVTKLLIEVGDKAAKPIFQKFAQQKAQVIDPTLQKIFKILLKEDHIASCACLRQELQKTLDHAKLTAENIQMDYINPIISWIAKGAQNDRLPLFYPKGHHLDHSIISLLQSHAKNFDDLQQSKEKEALFHSLAGNIHQELKDSKIAVGQNLDNDYVRPILNWLLLSDHTSPLTDLFKPSDQYREDLIDKVFEKAISLLVERKIDLYGGLLETKLQHGLGPIVLQAVTTNACRFADFFSERFAELVATVSFPQTFDALVHDVIATQIQGYLAAESSLQAHRAVLEKAKLAAQSLPKTAEELETKIRAQNHLASVARCGGEKQFFERVLIEEFSGHAACSPSMQQIIREEINLTMQGKDPSLVKQARQKAIFAAMAENVLAMMLPTHKIVGKNGQIEEIEPFMQLWEKLFLPKEFHELIGHVDELVSEFITPETATLFASIKQPALNFMQNMFKTAVQDLLKKQVGQLVQKGFESLTVPANLDEINATVTIPSLNSQLIKILISQQLTINVKTTAPLFKSLLMGKSSSRQANIRAIQDALIKLTKEKFSQFTESDFFVKETSAGGAAQLIYSDLTDGDWLRLTLPLIKQTEQQLLAVLMADGKPLDTSLITLDGITDILTATSKTSGQPNDPIFGQIVMDLIFKLGEWPYEGLIGFFVKDSLSSQLTEQTREMRASHTWLMTTLAENLKETFLDRKSIEKMLLSDSTPVQPPQCTAQKLTHQISILARLAHDLICHFAGQKGVVSKFAIKRIITNDSNTLACLIQTIYKKIFGNQTMNENLVLRTCEEIFRSISDAAVTLRDLENHRIHQALAKNKSNPHPAVSML